ncbi:hypothetical protein ATZ36_07315 [Candidatus Endomicrobiellum trichonymphae]|uniref:Uncharacterized protein n=1 Tax=Endomicrobium trichonymphae TaxID=1408204 RepID=A0A1E5IH64_ENDTX|nr:hypothetical protein ATZ36_07315 [Candidatus Endomicrobium trichonymphae]
MLRGEAFETSSLSFTSKTASFINNLTADLLGRCMLNLSFFNLQSGEKLPFPVMRCNFLFFTDFMQGLEISKTIYLELCFPLF